MNPTIQEILTALRSIRVPAMPEEYDIHICIKDRLQKANLPVEHEFRLAPRCRIDFKVGRIGIEVKKGKPSRTALISQLSRYLASDALDAMIVITQQSVQLPTRIGGKPVIVSPLNRLWGVALP